MDRPPLTVLETDVLIVGAGGAGMSAAIAAAGEGKQVLMTDRSLIGRGGATIMAQMTVAVALGEQEPDDWRFHYADTLAAGRGLCSEPLARLLCEEGVAAIRQMDAWGVGWAKADGHLTQAHAPGHDRPRCVYVDFLDTGPAVATTLRTQVAKDKRIRRIGDLLIVDLLMKAGRVVGAVALHLTSGQPVLIRAAATIIATGGLTRLYRRNSASVNMGGDGYALALRAGARLIDMEFVQFFPIGHLAPRLVGFDPIMWDPFRYKLGGRLLNGLGEEFVESYGHQAESGGYTVTRDAATYAILKEVEAGRGTPSGGAYLSFRHVPEARLREAFGPIIDRLAANGIDLTQTMIEVAPTAHYHMGGIRVDAAMATDVPGLFAAGEAVGGANGANRLSGNAITEAITFGVVAGRSAAALVAKRDAATGVASDPASDAASHAAPDVAELILLAEPVVAPLRRAASGQAVPVAELIVELQDIMQNDVGPFRNEADLHRAASAIAALRERLGNDLPGGIGPQDPVRIDGLDLRNMLMVAEAVVIAATARTESRGAHQRDDHPGMLDTWTVNQTLAWRDGQWSLAIEPVEHLPAGSIPDPSAPSSSRLASAPSDPSLPVSDEARA